MENWVEHNTLSSIFECFIKNSLNLQKQRVQENTHKILECSNSFSWIFLDFVAFIKKNNPSSMALIYEELKKNNLLKIKIKQEEKKLGKREKISFERLTEIIDELWLNILLPQSIEFLLERPIKSKDKIKIIDFYNKYQTLWLNEENIKNLLATEILNDIVRIIIEWEINLSLDFKFFLDSRYENWENIKNPYIFHLYLLSFKSKKMFQLFKEKYSHLNNSQTSIVIDYMEKKFQEEKK